jgi:N-methylhydantoinase A
MIMTDMKYAYVKGVLNPLDDLPDDFFEETWELMTQEFLSSIKRVTQADGPITTFSRSVDVRYLGQGFELEVQLPEQFNRLSLRELFEQKHEAVYGYRHVGEPLEVTALRLTATSAIAKPSLSLMEGAERRTRAETHRRVWFNDGWHDTLVLWRDNLSTSAPVDGPVIIEEYDSTTVVPPHWNCSSGKNNCLIMERKT